MTTAQFSQEITLLHANICSALADPKRILLVYALADEPHNVSDLSNTIGANQSSTSRHLKTLREAGLVTAERQGTTVEYRLADARLVEALNLLRAVLHDRLSRRASLIENDLPQP